MKDIFIFTLAALGWKLAHAVQVEGIALPDCILNCVGSPQAVKYFCSSSNNLDRLLLCAAVCSPSDMQAFLAAEEAMCAAVTSVIGKPGIVHDSGRHMSPSGGPPVRDTDVGRYRGHRQQPFDAEHNDADESDSNALDLKRRQRRYVQTDDGDDNDNDTSSCVPASTVTITVSVTQPWTAPSPSGYSSFPPPPLEAPTAPSSSPPSSPSSSSDAKATLISATDAVGFPVPSSSTSLGGGGATGGAPSVPGGSATGTPFPPPGTVTSTGTATLTSVRIPGVPTAPGGGGGGGGGEKGDKGDEGDEGGENGESGDNGGSGPSATSSGPPGVPTTGAAMALMDFETGMSGALVAAFWVVALL